VGSRSAARRLAGEVRRRLEPVERALPITLPGRGSGSGAGGEGAAAPESGDAEARIDAARERLRSTIAPPDDGG
jgi:hypothetical protein